VERALLNLDLADLPVPNAGVFLRTRKLNFAIEFGHEISELGEDWNCPVQFDAVIAGIHVLPPVV
jgi:hypothetical protein